MARKKSIKASSSEPIRRMPPAITPEAKENQMISLSMDLAEKQLLDGSASSQIITHFLKLATVKSQLELEKLRNENELLKAKSAALESAAKMEELYANAMAAMKSYRGIGDEEEWDDNDVEIL